MATQQGDAAVDTTMWTSLLHAGLAGSFLKLPHIAPDAAALRAHGARAAIYGIPWDSTSISRTGANYGPRGIREISSQFLSYNATWDFDLVEALNPVDCGDGNVMLANAEKTFANAERDIGEIVAAGAIPATLGGDHSVTIPAVRAVRKLVANPGLVLIDTHLDTALDVGGEELNHCCPITRAVDAGFDPKNIALLAISGWMNPRTELRYCREQGITVVWLEDIWERGVQATVEQALEVAGGGHGWHLPERRRGLARRCLRAGHVRAHPRGPHLARMLELVRGVSRHGLVGVDVVETAPSLDSSSVTAAIAGRVVMDALAAHAGALDG